MSEYKRLTERSGNGICIKETSTNDNNSIWNAIERLAELEDKIESGQAVILQANVGDMVYGVSEVLRRVIYGKLRWVDISEERIIYTVEENPSEDYLSPQYRLYYVYKTKEEAEAKLLEIKNGK